MQMVFSSNAKFISDVKFIFCQIILAPSKTPLNVYQ